ncbi:MAG TPA: hypothetical protein VNS63_19870 [Blastocatellia bacterium]|nr:hypothetical protein [Blastocatellia bacterium]
MCAARIKRLILGLFVASALTVPGFAQTATTAQQSSSVAVAGQKLNNKPVMLDRAADSSTVRDERNRALSLIDIEMLNRAESRSDALRAQLLELQFKEIELQAALDDLDYQLTPESIQQALVFIGSVRPMDELRAELRARLESRKSRINEQLELLVSSQARLEDALRDADADCARLRERLGLPRWSDGCQENDETTPGDRDSSPPDSQR